MIRLPHLFGAALILGAALWLGSYEPVLGISFLVFLIPSLLRARFPRNPRFPYTKTWWWRNVHPPETQLEELKRSIGAKEAHEAQERERARVERERLEGRHR